MKKYLLGFFLILSIGFTACKKDRGYTYLYQSTAWNYLTPAAKATVTIDWKTAIVEEINVDGKQLISVMFNTKQDALLGPIIVYINKRTRKAIGIAGRF